MYTQALEKMYPIFFACNRPNYVCWMSVYLLNLLNIEEICPAAKRALSNRGLSIKHSSCSFSHVPVDMALEQTVNKDAASRFGGIIAFANSDSAKARWMKEGISGAKL